MLPPSLDRDFTIYCLARIAKSRYADRLAAVTDAASAEELVDVFKALGHPMRVAILGWLKDPASFPPQDQPAEEVGVCLKHIQARAEVSQSTASQYMATLQRAGLVTCTRVGQWSHYRRNEDQIARVGRGVTTSI
jgi:ArsR family transcriptional regulator